MTPHEPPRRPKPITREHAAEVAEFWHTASEHGDDSDIKWSDVPEDERNYLTEVAYKLLDGGWIMNLTSDETHAIVELLTNMNVTCDGVDPQRVPLHISYVPALVSGFTKLAFANGRHYGLTNFDMGIEEDS